jgi:hypothetical protein
MIHRRHSVAMQKSERRPHRVHGYYVYNILHDPIKSFEVVAGIWKSRRLVPNFNDPGCVAPSCGRAQIKIHEVLLPIGP